MWHGAYNLARHNQMILQAAYFNIQPFDITFSYANLFFMCVFFI